eukprot:748492-Hanusia_phi.AAC.1
MKTVRPALQTSKPAEIEDQGGGGKRRRSLCRVQLVQNRTPCRYSSLLPPSRCPPRPTAAGVTQDRALLLLELASYGMSASCSSKCFTSAEMLPWLSDPTSPAVSSHPPSTLSFLLLLFHLLLNRCSLLLLKNPAQTCKGWVRLVASSFQVPEGRQPESELLSFASFPRPVRVPETSNLPSSPPTCAGLLGGSELSSPRITRTMLTVCQDGPKGIAVEDKRWKEEGRGEREEEGGERRKRGGR